MMFFLCKFSLLLSHSIFFLIMFRALQKTFPTKARQHTHKKNLTLLRELFFMIYFVVVFSFECFSKFSFFWYYYYLIHINSGAPLFFPQTQFFKKKNLLLSIWGDPNGMKCVDRLSCVCAEYCPTHRFSTLKM